MTEESNKENSIQVAVLGQYIRDFSFENPNAPQIFKDMPDQPSINLGVNVKTNILEDNNYEVLLMMKMESKTKNRVDFIAELAYCGIFSLVNMPKEKLNDFLFIEAPQLLFPFARNVIANAVRDGGFPQLLINPIDFATLYKQQQN